MTNTFTTKDIAQQVGINEKAVRRFARKNFDKLEGQWIFGDQELQIIKEAFEGTIKTPSTKAPKKSVGVIEGLTEGESLSINWLLEHGWWNIGEYFSDVTVSEVAEGINKPIASVKGYIGSLVKKGLIWIDDHEEPGVPSVIYWSKDKFEADEENNVIKYIG